MKDSYELKLSESKRNGWKEHIPQQKSGVQFVKLLDKIIDYYGPYTQGSFRASYLVNGGYGKNPKTGATIQITWKGTLNKIYSILELPNPNVAAQPISQTSKDGEG